MTDLLRSEWLKLRTLRMNIVFLVLGVAFVLVIIGLVGLFAPADEGTSGDIATIVGVAGGFAGFLVSVIGVLSVSSEFAHGTIRPTLVATPSRIRVFAVKAVLLAAIAAVVGTFVGLAGYLLGYGLISARGGERLEFLASDGTVPVLIGMPIFFVILVLFGYGLGLLIRISPAAVAIAILWPLIIEGILAAALAIAGNDDPVRFLPYQSSLALLVADSEGYANGRIGGGLYFAAVVAVLIVVAIFTNSRRDV